MKLLSIWEKGTQPLRNNSLVSRPGRPLRSGCHEAYHYYMGSSHHRLNWDGSAPALCPLLSLPLVLFLLEKFQCECISDGKVDSNHFGK